MPLPGQAQPELPGVLTFGLTNVTASEPGLAPSSIITAGNPVTLQTDLTVDGALAGLLSGESFSIFHHAQRLEDGALTTLAGGAVVVPVPPPPMAFSQVSGPFSTGAAGSGADLEIAPGFATGTWRILSHAHADNPAVKPIAAAFHEMVIMIT